MLFDIYWVLTQLSSHVYVFFLISGYLQIETIFHPHSQGGAHWKPLEPTGWGQVSPQAGTYFWLASISNRADRAEVPFFPTGGPVDSRECVAMGPVICKPFMAVPF